ncbi:MAG: O-acetyl-ADP-ribose deacetylase [Actinobacteria bacterium]|nr:O-acetyl-ADP-ribose deacetylase [Actinomycetota bacterium]
MCAGRPYRGGVPPRLRAALGDITAEATDAVVNAANAGLARGAGVCGAIFAAAGPGLAEACSAIGGCPTGGAVVTPGFALPARFIVHAVGPVWSGGEQDEPELLASAYRRSLEVAAEAGAQSIAFPAISTGIYRYPLVEATEVAVRTCRHDAPPGIQLIRFVCFDDATLAAYERELSG